MKKLLPLVAVFATFGVGCIGPMARSPMEPDIKPVPVEEFTVAPASTPAAPPVAPGDVNADNAKEMCRKLQKEIDGDQTDR